MTFDEWLNFPTASGEPRYIGIREFVGPTRYPGVEKLLADVYEVGYQQGYEIGRDDFRRGL